MQNVVTYDVVVGVDNSDLALVPGMTASTADHHRSKKRRAARAEPGAALCAGRPFSGCSTRALARRRADSRRSGCCATVEPVAVTVVPGLSDDNFTEIVKGDLNPGDQVITAESRGQAGGQSSLPPPRL